MLEEEKKLSFYNFPKLRPWCCNRGKKIIFVNEVSFNESFSIKMIKERKSMELKKKQFHIKE